MDQPYERILIADYATRCWHLLRCCLPFVDGERSGLAAHALDRFEQWSADINVRARLHASLDYRLQTRPMLKVTVNGTLKDLARHTYRALTADPNHFNDPLNFLFSQPVEAFLKNTFHDKLNSGSNLRYSIAELNVVVSSMDKLELLSLVIRHQTLSQRFNQATKLIGCVEDNGRQVCKDITVAFRHRVHTMLSEKWVKLHVDRAPDERESRLRITLQKRFEDAICLRACEFSYLERHPHPLECQRNRSIENIGHYNAEDASHDRRHVGLPRPPTVRPGTIEQMCPYCRLVMPAATFLDAKQWLYHLEQDLRPYICIFEDRSSSRQTYSSVKEWEDHLDQEHIQGSLPHPHHHGEVAYDGVIIKKEVNASNESIPQARTPRSISATDEYVEFTNYRQKMPFRCPICLYEPPGIEHRSLNLKRHIADHQLSIFFLALLPRVDPGHHRRGGDGTTDALASGRRPGQNGGLK